MRVSTVNVCGATVTEKTVEQADVFSQQIDGLETKNLSPDGQMALAVHRLHRAINRNVIQMAGNSGIVESQNRVDGQFFDVFQKDLLDYGFVPGDFRIVRKFRMFDHHDIPDRNSKPLATVAELHLPL